MVRGSSKIRIAKFRNLRQRNWFSRSSKTKTKAVTKLALNLPLIITTIYFIESFVIYYSEWYYENHLLLDRVDDFLMFYTLFDCFLLKRILKYDLYNIISGFGLVFIIITQILLKFKNLNIEDYGVIYKGIITGVGIALLIIKIQNLWKK
jgi:hypothetical protein